MTIYYDDVHEKFEFYCHKCNHGIKEPHFTNYCPHCGNKLTFANVNLLRNKIASIIDYYVYDWDLKEDNNEI